MWCGVVSQGPQLSEAKLGWRTMFAPVGQTTARAGLRSKLAALVVRRQAGPRLRGCTPLRTPIRKSEGPMAKRTQYYCPFLTPSALPPLLSRELRGCERGATVERSETEERAMFAPAGQTPARAGQLCWLAALVVRRQAPPTPRRGEQQRCRGGIYAARNLPRQPVNGKGTGLTPSLAPLVRDPFTAVCRGRACPARNPAITTPYPLHRRAASHRAFA